jgi:hypothetical protein
VKPSITWFRADASIVEVKTYRVRELDIDFAFTLTVLR